MRSNDDGIFRTRWLQFGIFLHASKLLPYVRTETGPDGKACFLYEDKDAIGPRLQLEFSQGAKVSATDLFGSQIFIRREMESAKRLGEQHHVTSHLAR